MSLSPISLLPWKTTSPLYNDEGIKTYYNGVSIGGGLGVKLLDRVKSIHALDIRAKALSSVGCPSWKRSSYDVSLAWYLKSYRFSPVVELGYRFIDSHTSGLDNCGNVFPLHRIQILTTVVYLRVLYERICHDRATASSTKSKASHHTRATNRAQ